MADYEQDSLEDLDYNKPMSLSVWKKMLPFIRPQKNILVICIVLMIVVAIIDIALPLLLGQAIRYNIQPRSLDGAWLLIGLFTFMTVIQGVLVHFFVSLGIKAESGMSRGIRNAVFNHLQKLSLSYYNKTPVGYLMARTNSDTSRIGDLVAWGLIDFTWSVFYCVGAIIAMFIVHWKLAIIVCVTIPFLALLTWFFQSRILKVNRIMRRINSKMTGAMNEGITGARTVKTLVAEKQSLADYSSITSE
ncbi:MAG: ABC transporter transmembrane domain-containing protein, partial [Treponema sp.]|nr:ABC transporter transmembrane domain-containing protein [Treponema sp.]